MTEREFQRQCVVWFRKQYRDTDQWRLHANKMNVASIDGKNAKWAASRMIADGSLPGIPDLVDFFATEHQNSLWPELKRPGEPLQQSRNKFMLKSSHLNEQYLFMRFLNKNRHYAFFCNDFDTFCAIIKQHHLCEKLPNWEKVSGLHTPVQLWRNSSQSSGYNKAADLLYGGV